eukprot:Nk52_evm9s238 gene=Nk52_evmTU9s238
MTKNVSDTQSSEEKSETVKNTTTTKVNPDTEEPQPVPSQEEDSSTPPLVESTAAATPVPGQRPKLNLLPRTVEKESEDDVLVPRSADRKHSDPFGGAKPRELNVSEEDEKRIQKKFEEIDLQHEAATVSATKAEAGSNGAEGSSSVDGSGRTNTNHKYHHQQGRNYHHMKGRYGNNHGLENYNNNGNNCHRINNNNGANGNFFRGGFNNNSNNGGRYGYNNNSNYNNSNNNNNRRFQNQGYNHDQMDQFGSRTGRAPPGEGYTCKICNSPGHWIQDCPNYMPGYQKNNRFYNNNEPRVPHQGYICKICNTPGHFLKDCANYRPNNNNNGRFKNNTFQGNFQMDNNNGMSDFDGLPPPGYMCKICEIPGHWIRDCPDYKHGGFQQHNQQMSY